MKGDSRIGNTFQELCGAPLHVTNISFPKSLIVIIDGCLTGTS
jgi:hypothetical protein